MGLCQHHHWIGALPEIGFLLKNGRGGEQGLIDLGGFQSRSGSEWVWWMGLRFVMPDVEKGGAARLGAAHSPPG